MAAAPKSDPQRERLYRMERACFKGWDVGRMTVPQIELWVKRVARKYGVQVPAVTTKELPGYAGEYWDGRITLCSQKESGKTLLTLTHEMAHHIHEQLGDAEKDEAHGPEFLTCYVHLLHTLKLVPALAMQVICETHRLDHYPFRKPPTTDRLRRLITQS